MNKKCIHEYKEVAGIYEMIIGYVGDLLRCEKCGKEKPIYNYHTDNPTYYLTPKGKKVFL